MGSGHAPHHKGLTPLIILLQSIQVLSLMPGWYKKPPVGFAPSEKLTKGAWDGARKLEKDLWRKVGELISSVHLWVFGGAISCLMGAVMHGIFVGN